MSKIFELGPKPIYGKTTEIFIALANEATNPRMNSGGQDLVGRECSSISELEAQVDQMKKELDNLVIEARKRFS